MYCMRWNIDMNVSYTVVSLRFCWINRHESSDCFDSLLLLLLHRSWKFRTHCLLLVQYGITFIFFVISLQKLARNVVWKIGHEVEVWTFLHNPIITEEILDAILYYTKSWQRSGIFFFWILCRMSKNNAAFR